MIDLAATQVSPWRDGERFWRRMSEATAELPAPVAVISQEALAFNARDMLARAAGVPIRVASKSVRVRGVLDAVLRLPGYRGILAFTLAEALWLAEDHDDVVVAYPTADREALARLAADEGLAARVTLMVDSEEQLDLVDAVVAPVRRPALRIAVDVDASWLAPGLGHIGVRRSPLFTVGDVTGLAHRISRRAGFELVGLQMYEAQIAGQADGHGAQALAVRWMKRRSGEELRARRPHIVRAVSDIAPLEFVLGGGTGSLEYTARDSSVTEITAGSGLLAGHLFDGYRGFAPAPASAFAVDVVRRPAADIATVLGAGWIASGAPGTSRLPRPVWPAGLRLEAREGAGEVQTPLRGSTARALSPGDRVWFRHAKSGELAERAAEFALLHEGRIVDMLPGYRGEGRAFL